VQGRYEEIKGLGAEVLAVSFEPAGRLPRYRERHGWAFPVVADPSRTAYKAFGLGSAGWTRLLKPRVVGRYLGLMHQRYHARLPGDDVHQLGGDFVVDDGRRLVYAYRSADPADRPPASALVSALAALGPGATGPQPPAGGGTS